jgi:hypothetical protein
MSAFRVVGDNATHFTNAVKSRAFVIGREGRFVACASGCAVTCFLRPAQM